MMVIPAESNVILPVLSIVATSIFELAYSTPSVFGILVANVGNTFSSSKITSHVSILHCNVEGILVGVSIIESCSSVLYVISNFDRVPLFSAIHIKTLSFGFFTTDLLSKISVRLLIMREEYRLNLPFLYINNPFPSHFECPYNALVVSQ